MQPLYLKYYKPSVYFVMIFLLIADAGLIHAVATEVDLRGVMFDLLGVVPMFVITFFFVTDGLVPVMQNKPVCIIDENGFTDIISWGLIRWSNIESIVPFKATSLGKGKYSFTQMYVLIKEVADYEAYQNSRWIRCKLAFYRRGRGALIVVDIDALEGNAIELVNTINAYFDQYRNKKL